jgi:hypothetical protein
VLQLDHRDQVEVQGRTRERYDLVAVETVAEAAASAAGEDGSLRSLEKTGTQGIEERRELQIIGKAQRARRQQVHHLPVLSDTGLFGSGVGKEGERWSGQRVGCRGVGFLHFWRRGSRVRVLSGEPPRVPQGEAAQDGQAGSDSDSSR